MTSNTDVMSSLKANNPGAEVAVLPMGWNVPRGKMPQGRGYWPFGMIMGINYEATNEQRIAVWMFMEWLSKSETTFTLQNGIAGQNYRLQANGLPERLNYTGESNLSPNSNKDYWCLVVEALSYPTEDMFWAANKALWSPPDYGNLVDDLIKYYRAATPYRTPDALFTVPIASMQEHRADLNVLFQELYVKCVTATEAQFETVYADACRTYLAAGYQAILTEKQRIIAAGNYMK
jgi:putative aldouronate transport system substrate-binding protein